MTIIKKPTLEVAADAFIAGAPDAAITTRDGPRRVRKGRKVQITLTITEPLLERVDQLAGEIGQSRAGVINLAVLQMLQSGLRIEKSE